ncbi:hypothetical protein [Bradyrhizobium sp. 930_D9_N1_4]|uniref:hypothetical protein n=1 Tax=Bradyrhizobium sp. 930_D9_N1_4 TaxID=3240374 RepID=UPI003F8B742E
MSDWLHNLPVPVMALAIFGFTYLLAAAIFAGTEPVAPSVQRETVTSGSMMPREPGNAY